MRLHLIQLLVYVLYPLWLAAGAIDYLCHRRSNISFTSGVTESWLHVVQFVLLVLALAAYVFVEMSAWVFGLVVSLVVLHTVVAYVDVRYTLGKRHISALEQHAHAFMDVVPVMAVLLIGVLGWTDILATDAPAFRLKQPSASEWLLLGSFTLLSGSPIMEELLRTRRCAVTSASPPSGRTPPPAPQRPRSRARPTSAEGASTSAG